MATIRARRFEYEASVDRAGRVAAGSDPPVELSDAWTPEHLLLAGLVRCSISSLAYHARRGSLAVAASGSATGAVTMRESDGRYAFVEIECRLDVELDPAPAGEDMTALLANAERDCFVGASLAVKPRYRWRVNGREVP